MDAGDVRPVNEGGHVPAFNLSGAQQPDNTAETSREQPTSFGNLGIELAVVELQILFWRSSPISKNCIPACQDANREHLVSHDGHSEVALGFECALREHRDVFHVAVVELDFWIQDRVGEQAIVA